MFLRMSRVMHPSPLGQGVLSSGSKTRLHGTWLPVTCASRSLVLQILTVGTGNA